MSFDFHYISEDKVNEAASLASRGEQRLYNISEKTTTVFDFLPSNDEHFAHARIWVLPAKAKGSPYISYEISVYYQTCCDKISEDLVHKQTQLVYDTYIQAVRRRFDNGW
jgi:hypothetical protein